MSNPEKRVRGKKYKNTIGKILDYNAISIFLQNKILMDKSINCLIDLPCGNGNLLEKLAENKCKVELIGIDNSKEQLEEAITDNRISYIQADIFNLSELNQKLENKICFCHIGFSFFNVFNEKARIKILKELFKCKFISGIGFEIQNTQFQSTFFQTGIWHKKELNDGIILLSKSDYIEPNRKKLLLKFKTNESERLVEEELYDWNINTCKTDATSSGWRDVNIQIAEYREIRENINSHYFITLKR